MEWVKTTAKTLPEAIDLALDNLGVDESEAEIVVLEEPRQGLFGRMRGTARVEARVKPKAIRPKTERSRSRRSRSEGGSRGGRSKDRSKNRKRSSGQGGPKGAGQDAGQGAGQGAGKGAGKGGGRSSGKGGGKAGGQGRGGRKDDRQDDDRQMSREPQAQRKRSGQDGRRRSTTRGGDSDHETKPSEGASVEEVAAHLRTFLRDLTDAFGFDSEVVVDDSEQDLLIGRIEGQHGLLVGPKGRTLDAVQELARISCQRAVPSNIRIRVDVGGYREQRVQALATFAAKAADRAVEESSEVALEPMSAADRKAIHDALSEDDRVETRSVGTEPRRKVLVVPVVDAADDAADEPVDDAADDAVDHAVDHAADEPVDDAVDHAADDAADEPVDDAVDHAADDAASDDGERMVDAVGGGDGED